MRYVILLCCLPFAVLAGEGHEASGSGAARNEAPLVDPHDEDMHGADDHADEDHGDGDDVSGLDDTPLTIRDSEDLRELAEIDGDRQTFTQDEQVKFLLLGQLLGVEADLPVPE